MPIDMHCHTKVSDGSVSVDELIFIARRMGINSLAITDHDTFAGAKRALVLSERYGINIILGAELSSFSKKFGKELHILCYMCDYPDRLEGICSKNTKARKRFNLEIINQVSKYYPITFSNAPPNRIFIYFFIFGNIFN